MGLWGFTIVIAIAKAFFNDLNWLTYLKVVQMRSISVWENSQHSELELRSWLNPTDTFEL